MLESRHSKNEGNHIKILIRDDAPDSHGVIRVEGHLEPHDERLWNVRALQSNGMLTRLNGNATYARGLFEQKPQEEGEPSTTPNALNLPSTTQFQLGESDQSTNGNPAISDLQREFDIKHRVQHSIYTHRDERGRITDVRITEFVSRDNPHLALRRVDLMPRYSGNLTFRTGIDGDVINEDARFLSEVQTGHVEGLGLIYWTRTPYKKEQVYVGQHTEVRAPNGDNITPEPKVEKREKSINQVFNTQVKSGKRYSVISYSNYHTTADGDLLEGKIDHAHGPLQKDLAARPSWEQALEAHRKASEKLHDQIHVKIEGDDALQIALHFNHSTVASAIHTGYPYAGMGAKEGFPPETKPYGGRHFWDAEIYTMDNLTPGQAKTMVMYRFNQLDAAREKARRYTSKKEKPGAFWAWEASRPEYGEGCPETVRRVDGKIVPIEALEQEIHISSAVAHGAIEYYRMSGDEDFLRNQGAEMILEAARFYRNRSAFNKKANRHEFHGVTGPDEYQPNVNNNAYTNVMAKWTVNQALELIREGKVSKEVLRDIKMDAQEVKALRKFADKIYIPFDPETFLFKPFDGWEQLEHVDLSKYPGITAMDEHLIKEQKRKIEIGEIGKEDAIEYPIRSTNVAKQPDTTLAPYLLGHDILKTLPVSVLDELHRKGFSNSEIIQNINKANHEKFTPLCSEGSSLAPNTNVGIALKAGEDPNSVYDKYVEAAGIDLYSDTHGTRNGLHTAAAGGSHQTAKRGFGGIENGADALMIDPNLPSRWHSLNIRSFYMGTQYQAVIDQRSNTITVEMLNGGNQNNNSIPLSIRGRRFMLDAHNPSVRIPYREPQEQKVFDGLATENQKTVYEAIN